MRYEDDKLIFNSGRVVPADEVVIVPNNPQSLGYYWYNEDHGYGDAGAYELELLSDLTYEEKADAINYMCRQWENFRIASIGRGMPGDAYAITHGDGRIELLNK